MTSAIVPGPDIATALRIAERIRDELRSDVGLTGLRLQIARAPVPLTIGLDDARGAGDAVLFLALSDGEREIATILVSDASRSAYSPEDADAVRAVIERHRPDLREWLRGPGAT